MYRRGDGLRVLRQGSRKLPNLVGVSAGGCSELLLLALVLLVALLVLLALLVLEDLQLEEDLLLLQEPGVGGVNGLGLGRALLIGLAPPSPRPFPLVWRNVLVVFEFPHLGFAVLRFPWACGVGGLEVGERGDGVRGAGR